MTDDRPSPNPELAPGLDPALDPATLVVRGVRAPAPETLPEGLRARPHVAPVYLGVAYDFPSVAAGAVPLGGEQGYAYGRYGHPNGRELEGTVAALEGAEAALATASGMAAMTATVITQAQAGDTILLQRDAYGGTAAMFREDLGRLGIRVEAVDAYDVESVTRALESGPRLLIVETISNPLVRTPDLAALASACHAAGAKLVVDGTFATPILSRPLDVGADVVLHSATKYLGGHHDVVAGVVCGDAETIAAARRTCVRLGGTIAPFDAWLVLRGLRTLALRVERAQENARGLVSRLGDHQRVQGVNYPGWGAMFSFDLGSLDAAERFIGALRLVTYTASLGGVATTLSHPCTSSHRSLSTEEREGLGIGDGLVRISTGIEALDDIWTDLAGAVDAAAA